MRSHSIYRSYDHISVPIFVLEANELGQPVYAAINATALDIANRPLSDFLGRRALDVFPLAYGRAAYAHHCAVMQRGVEETYELSLPLDGSVRAIRTTLRPERDAQGQVIRLYGVATDITAERDAQEAKAEFHTLSSEMEEFVAFAAHDLRAPMRNIVLLTEILRQDLGDQSRAHHELLDLMDSIASKSLDLISEVLSHAKTVSTAKHETVFSFPALCQQILDTIDPTKTHTVRTSLSSIKADRSAVQIALRNLIENAVKHGRRTALKIDVSVQAGMPGLLDITLTDNGRGFTDATLKAINGNQFHTDTGYGLFGIKRLITARGGTLIARNLPDGDGGAVRFSLPGRLVGHDALTDRPADTVQGQVPKNGRRYSA